MKLPIYLDYASTTPIDTRVVKKMMKCCTINGIFGNPASRDHYFGWKAEEEIDIARNNIAALINADPYEIIFTSGATESINLAIKGIAKFYKKGKHLITSKTEHKAVLNTCQQLESEGFYITYITPKKNGIISLNQIHNEIRENTILVSIMHVNNEIGIIQNIKQIAKLCAMHNILYHVDATQSAGKIPIDIQDLKIDLMSFSAHKMYGPKGIGVLYIKRSLHTVLQPQIHGGNHEHGIRAGTLPVHQIVGMGEACRIAKKMMKSEYNKIFFMNQYFWKNIEDMELIQMNGKRENIIPNIFNISFKNMNKSSLILAFKDLAVSFGAACNSSLQSSYVLRALGISDKLAHNSIRFSFGRFTTYEEVNFTINIVRSYVSHFEKKIKKYIKC